MKKLFGGLNLTWTKLIVFAVFIGIYTGVMALLPITRDTSFRDISTTFECWILFGIIIICNSGSPLDSALKCFVFFLISQPLVYLVQVPFHFMGFGLFGYYWPWFRWTLLTIPMGYIGYYMKDNKWYSLAILTPMLVFLGSHYCTYLRETVSFFPNHLLTTLFCLVTLIIYPLSIFDNKRLRLIGLGISLVIVVVMSFLAVSDPGSYNTTVLMSDSEGGIEFDENCDAQLEDERFGRLFAVYDKNIDCYMLNAEFTATGVTRFTIRDVSGVTHTYEITVYRDSYEVRKINP